MAMLGHQSVRYAYAAGNPISFQDPTGLAVYVGQHGAFFPGDPLQHSAIVLVPDNPADFAAFALFQAKDGHLATLGGQPSGFNGDGIDLFGTLVGSANYPGDSPCNLHDITLVPTPSGMSDTQFIQQLLREFAAYGNNLATTFRPLRSLKHHGSSDHFFALESSAHYLRLTIMTHDVSEGGRKLRELIVDPRELEKVLSSIPINDRRSG